MRVPIANKLRSLGAPGIFRLLVASSVQTKGNGGWRQIRLEEEKKAISDDIREVYAEMKGRGFDVKAVRQIIKIRKQDHSERKEMEAIVELYMSALNMT